MGFVMLGFIGGAAFASGLYEIAWRRAGQPQLARLNNLEQS
jgi:hypothetical protein